MGSLRAGEAVRRCTTPGCGHVMVCRVGDACPRCRRGFTDGSVSSEAAAVRVELPPGFVLVGAWPRDGAA